MSIALKGITNSILNLNLNNDFQTNKNLIEHIETSHNIKKDSFILFLRNKIVNPSEDFLIPIDLDIYEVRFKLLGGKVKYLLLF